MTTVINGVRRANTTAEQSEQDARDALGPITEAAAAAHAAREAKYATDTAAGFSYQGKTYSMAPVSLANWQKMAVTLRAEIDALITAENEAVAMFDSAGEVVAFEADDALTLLASIGKQAREWQVRDYQWSGMIAAAATVAELEAIQAVIESA